MEHARRVATQFGTDHHELVVKPDAISILDDLIAHFDEPFADSSAIPTWYVSQMAPRHVTVALSGDGGDELFGGYDRYLPHPTGPRLRSATVRGRFRQVAGLRGRRLPHGPVERTSFAMSAEPTGPVLDAIRYLQRRRETRSVVRMTSGRVSNSDPEPARSVVRPRLATLPWPSQMMRFDLETYLPDDILTKVDRMSMAHSIESASHYRQRGGRLSRSRCRPP